MAKLLHEIEWGKPLLDMGPSPDPEDLKKLSPWIAAGLLALSERERVAWGAPALVNVAPAGVKGVFLAPN